MKVTGQINGLDKDLMEKLQKLADELQRNILVTSGYRIGDPGFHGKRIAADIIVQGIPLYDLFKKTEALNLFTGIGVYPTWTDGKQITGGLHLDTRPARARWIGLGNSKGQQYVGLSEENLIKHGIKTV